MSIIYDYNIQLYSGVRTEEYG